MSRLVRLDRLDSLNLAKSGIYEKFETSYVRKSVKPGMTFIDVGAHIGYYSTMAAALVKQTGTVHAFEPMPDNLAALRENAAQYRGTIHVHPVALSDACGRATLTLNPKNTGDNRLSPVEGWPMIEVETTTLDEALPDTVADFIKIDAQGSETAILRGAKALIERSPNLTGIIEYAPFLLGYAGSSGMELIALLRNYGFSVGMNKGSRIVPAKGELLPPHKRRFINIFIRRRPW